MRKTLVWLTEEDPEDPGNNSPYLGYRDSRWGEDGPEATDASLEEIADLCDREAENANAHDFVGCHRLLAALLHRRLGREAATGVIREVAELGGLWDISGRRFTSQNVYKELGTPSPWGDWKLKDPEG